MIRKFLSGIVFGGVIAGLGLAVISQVTPMPARLDQAANSDQAPVAEPVAEPVVEPVVAAEPAPAPEPAPEPVPEPASESADAVAQPSPPEAAPPATNDVAPATPTAPTEANDLPEVAQPGDSAPRAPVLAAKPVMPAADQPQVSPDLPPAALAETADPLLTPPAEPAPAPATDLATDLAIDAPSEAPLVQDASPAPTPEAPPADLATALPEVPEPGLNKTVEGVTTGRLPTIAAADPAPAADAPPADTPADTLAEAPLADLPPADPRPIAQFARAFSNDSGKPAFAVVLIDNGAADLDRAALAALPFPVSFVIDPLDPSAASAAAAYRAGGQEVIMLASGIPRGANPSDLEQTFQSNAQVLPETVAVMDLDAGGFQDDRQLAAQVVPLIKAQGRGLLTFDRGLNAADQVAQREGVESAVIFRELDAEAEDTPLIRRYLDRAAFKAAQEGRVVVLGTTRPETIAALMEWTVEGRAASVALAPLTAVLVAQ